MLIVLIIVSVLSLLIFPNVMDTKAEVDEKGQYALEQLIDTQIQLYEMTETNPLTSGNILNELKSEGYLTQKQLDQAVKWEITR